MWMPMASLKGVFGALDRIRTCDLPLRRRSLYPTELRGRRNRMSRYRLWGTLKSATAGETGL